MRKFVRKKKIGLGLGGGAVLGAAHIGVLKALEENEISISYVAGTSIGAFVSAFYAFKKDLNEIEKIALDLDWFDLSGISLSQSGLLSNKKLGELISEHIGDVHFDQADIPLAMIATDIASGKKVVLQEGKVAKAAMASTCIPGIFIPVEIDDTLLVDGGIVENVPITPLQEMGAEFIIAVDLNARRSHKKPENIIEVLMNAFDFTMMTATKLQSQEADLIIKPDLSGFNMIDTEQTPDLIERGYDEAIKMLKKL
jgi:NTE family protein